MKGLPSKVGIYFDKCNPTSSGCTHRNACGVGRKNRPVRAPLPQTRVFGRAKSPKCARGVPGCKKEKPTLPGRPLDDYAGKDLLLEVREVSLCEVGIITPAGILLEDTL